MRQLLPFHARPRQGGQGRTRTRPSFPCKVSRLPPGQGRRAPPRLRWIEGSLFPPGQGRRAPPSLRIWIEGEAAIFRPIRILVSPQEEERRPPSPPLGIIAAHARRQRPAVWSGTMWGMILLVLLIRPARPPHLSPAASPPFRKDLIGVPRREALPPPGAGGSIAPEKRKAWTGGCCSHLAKAPQGLLCGGEDDPHIRSSTRMTQGATIARGRRKMARRRERRLRMIPFGVFRSVPSLVRPEAAEEGPRGTLGGKRVTTLTRPARRPGAAGIRKRRHRHRLAEPPG